MKRDSKQVLTELLVFKAQDGDERAFADLYELWKLDLIRLGRSVLSDRDAMEEAVQETWIAIARGIKKLDDPARFRAWAFSVLRRKCVDLIRRESRQRRRQDELRESHKAVPMANEGYSSGSARAALAESIQNLDTDGRLLVHLYYEADLSIGELSQALGIPAGTVKSRLHAVREVLRRELERLRK